MVKQIMPTTMKALIANGFYFIVCYNFIAMAMQSNSCKQKMRAATSGHVLTYSPFHLGLMHHMYVYVFSRTYPSVYSYTTGKTPQIPREVSGMYIIIHVL